MSQPSSSPDVVPDSPQAPRASARRSPIGQVAIVAVAIALAGLVAVHLFGVRDLRVKHLHTEILATRSIAYGPNPAHDVLFVAVTLEADNPAATDATLNDLEMVVIDPGGAKTTVPQVPRENFLILETFYPGLRAMLSTPLVRNTLIPPGKSLQGAALFTMNTNQAAWTARRTAIVQVKYDHTSVASFELPTP